MKPAKHILLAEGPDDPFKAPAGQLALPLVEGKPRNGETVAAFLDRVKWDTGEAPFVCSINRRPILREQWALRRIRANDNVIFFSRPGKSGGSGMMIAAAIGMIALVALAPYAAPAIVGAAGAAGLTISTATAGFIYNVALAGGALLLSHLLKPKSAAKSTGGGASPYSFAFGGNMARPLQPIPVRYGRHLFQPDFAAPPYSEFTGDTMTEFALYSLGCGEYDPEEIRLGETTIWTKAGGKEAGWEAFDYEIVAPGDNVTLFPVDVVTSNEVSDIALNNTDFTPWHTVNASTTLARELIFDLIWPNGSFINFKDRILGPETGVQLQARLVNDAGVAIGGEVDLYPGTGIAIFKFAKQSPIRLTLRFPVASGRYQVRMRRSNMPISATPGTAGNEDLVWHAARAQIDAPQAFPGVTTLAVRAMAQASNSGMTAAQIKVIAPRILDAVPGYYAKGVTRSIVRAAIDAWTNSQYSFGGSYTRLDMDTLAAIDAELEAEGWTFDHSFTNAIPVSDALETIFRAGRAIPVPLGDRLSAIREKPRGVPVMLFTDDSIVRGSLRVKVDLPKPNTATGTIGQYFDEDTWHPTEAPSWPDGEPDATRPAYLDLIGVTKRVQAIDLARFSEAENRLRRTQVQWRSELEGLILARGDCVALSSRIPTNWGESGTIASWNPTTKRLTFNHDIDAFPGRDYFVEIRDREGRLFGPVAVSAKIAEKVFELDASDLAAVELTQGPIASALTRAATEEPPAFVFGEAGSTSFRVIVTGGSPSGRYVDLTGAIDDPDVYEYTLDGIPNVPIVRLPFENGSPPAILNIQARMFQRHAALVLAASIEATGDAVEYEARISYDAPDVGDEAASWTPAYRGSSSSFEAILAGAAAIRLNARARNARGTWSRWYAPADLVPPTLTLSAEFFDTIEIARGDLAFDIDAEITAAEDAAEEALAAADDAFDRANEIYDALSPTRTIREGIADPSVRSLRDAMSEISRAQTETTLLVRELRGAAIDGGLEIRQDGARFHFVQNLEGRIASNTTAITALGVRIDLFSSVTNNQNLNDVTTTISQIILDLDNANSRIDARVTLETFTNTTADITTLEIRMAAAEDAISLIATTATIDELVERVTQVEVAIGGGGFSVLATDIKSLKTSRDRTSETISDLMRMANERFNVQSQVISQAAFSVTARINEANEAISTSELRLTAIIGVTNAEVSRVDKAQSDGITALASSVQTLSTTVLDPTTGLARATSRLSTVEQSITTPGQAIGNRFQLIETSILDPVSGLTQTRARVGTVETAITTPGQAVGSRITTIETGVNDPVTGLAQTRTRVGTAETAISLPGQAVGSRINSIDAALFDPVTGLSQTRSRVTTAESAITTPGQAVGSRINLIDTTVNNPTTGLVAAHGRALTLENVVTTPGQVIGSRFTGLEAAVADPTTGLAQTRARVQTIEGVVTRPGLAIGTRVTLMDADVYHASSGLLAAHGRAQTIENVMTTPGQVIGNRLQDLIAEVHDTTTGLPTTRARVSTVEGVVTRPGQAIGSRLTEVEATANNATATARVRMDVQAGPAGVASRIAQEVSAAPGGSYAFAGEYLDIMSDGTRRKTFHVNQFRITDGVSAIDAFAIGPGGTVIIPSLEVQSLSVNTIVPTGLITKRLADGVATQGAPPWQVNSGPTGGFTTWLNVPDAAGKGFTSVTFGGVPQFTGCFARMSVAVACEVNGNASLAGTLDVELGFAINGIIIDATPAPGVIRHVSLANAGITPTVTATRPLIFEGLGLMTVTLLYRYNISGAVGSSARIAFRGGTLSASLTMG